MYTIQDNDNNNHVDQCQVPDLPLTCLNTAEYTSTSNVLNGKNTVIDFWTTRCTRCPEALDILNDMAKQSRYSEIQFISVCCDSGDGARNIIEERNEPRWGFISHYHQFRDPIVIKTSPLTLIVQSILTMYTSQDHDNENCVEPHQVPHLPLTCLNTAEYTSTSNVTNGKNTVIDFWTTKCTRCPDALDKLNDMAMQSRYSDIQFISICCDSGDGARNIIEERNEPRWGFISHYHMEDEYKEIAKKILGFQQVPFYVVVDATGSILQKGSSKVINFELLPGVVRHNEEDLTEEKNDERGFIIDDDFDF
eukprot:CAMPEP_0172520730 /NCGR_PEP_ID=MMETSP1066-20121228/292174_1 /TAXON_ID=671091 /ORGANISM="Coscinodiscus wailesii, Strain CCMP2513" /LENGTH=307 /DNA_ID=CAMNT_0013303537 /DNA_START=50 /DNA_END=972 /DNA_ORIENTATION=+